MKKIFVIFLCCFLLAPASIVLAQADAEPTGDGVIFSVGDFTVVASKGVTLEITATPGTYTGTSTHDQGTKTYSTNQDDGISEAAK